MIYQQGESKYLEGIMRKIGVIIFFVFFLLALPQAQAASWQQLKASSRVVDIADILLQPQQDRLEESLKQLEFETSNQIVVVTLKSLEGSRLEDVSIDLATRWGIGQRIKNNGILILVALEERQVRIEVGYGLETTITDALAAAIIRESMIPNFKKGAYEAAIMAGVDALREVLLQPDVKKFFVMPWDITNFENFIQQFPASLLKCDGLLFLGRLHEDKWEAALFFSKKQEKAKAISFYERYLNECPQNLWLPNARKELLLLQQDKSDHQNFTTK